MSINRSRPSCVTCGTLALFLITLSGCNGGGESAASVINYPPDYPQVDFQPFDSVASSGVGGNANTSQVRASSNSSGVVDPTGTMAFYDQTDPGLMDINFPGTQTQLVSNPSSSQLCGPTSSSMILDGILKHLNEQGIQPIQGSWADRYFIQGESAQPPSRPIRILTNTISGENRIAWMTPLVAGAAGTGIITRGATTTQVSGAMNAIAGNFPAGVVTSFLSPAILQGTTGNALIGQMNRSQDSSSHAPDFGPGADHVGVLAVNVGYYIVQANPSGAQTYASFRRVGGHFVVFSGYYKDSTGVRFSVHNPFGYHTVQNYSVIDLKNYSNVTGQTNINYNGQMVSSLSGVGYIPEMSTNSQIAIIERYTGLAIPLGRQ